MDVNKLFRSTTLPDMNLRDASNSVAADSAGASLAREPRGHTGSLGRV